MQIEATGKSVEIAIQNGLLECGMKREDVQVKIIDAGGLFKKAKVVLIWGEEEKFEPEVEENNTDLESKIEPETAEDIEPIEESKPEEKEKKKRIVDTERLEKKKVKSFCWD